MVLKGNLGGKRSYFDHCFHPLLVSLTLFNICSTTSASTDCSTQLSRTLNVSAEFNFLNMSIQKEGYSTDVTCEWLLKAPSSSQTIKVTIVKLDTECSWDRLYIYDGKSFRDKLLAVYSGTLLPRPVYATSGFMLIYFFSDHSNTASGFQLKYSLDNSSPGVIQSAIGDADKCSTDSDCNNVFGTNRCDRATAKCICQAGFQGAFCEWNERTTTRNYDKWYLMSVGTQAMSRAGHKVAMISDTVYVYGGYDYTSTSNQLYRGDGMYTFSLITPTSGSVPEGRHSHQMVSERANLPLYTDIGVPSGRTPYGEDSLYVYGGVLSNGSLTSQLWQYKTDTNSWTRLADSPLAVADHVMVTVDNRWLFTHGGRSDSTQDNPIDGMYVYDTKEGTWSRQNYASGYESSLRLAGHTAVVKDYMIYVYGGYTQRSARFLQIQNILWKFDTKERIWSKIEMRHRNIPSLAFHAATLHSDKMIVYGGKLNSTSQCLNTDLFVFDISCQQWLNNLGPANSSLLHRPVGQYGHDILVQHGMLYVYGGVQGSLTYDVIAVGVDKILSQDVSRCDPCSSQSVCQSCTLLSVCKWCPDEGSCVSASDLCANSYGGDNLPLVNMSECMIKDTPAGWYYSVYKYPVNESQPDEVHLTINSKIIWYLDKLDYVCPSCPSYMLARGYIFGRPGVPFSNFRFTVIRNDATLYKVVDNITETEISSIRSSVSQTDELVKPSDVALGYGASYMQYKAYQNPILNLTSHATVGLVEQFSAAGLSFPHLRPYSSGLCSLHTNCLLCTSDSSCGWCDSQSKCTNRSLDKCNNGSDWMKYSPVYCERCEVFTNCPSCTQSSSRCEWLPDVHKCLRRGRRPHSITSVSMCSQACNQRLNCTVCLGNEVDECVWCSTLSQCIPMDVYQLDYQFGECLHYQVLGLTTDSSPHSDRDTCVECSMFTTCDSCSNGGLFCGWCSNNTEPTKGVCVSGDFSGPQSQLTCSAIISDKGGEVWAATWSFRECPDMLECSLGGHNCVEHSRCEETLAAFECHCERGYKGVGNVSCERTCYDECVHGTCVQHNETEFMCECDLGWMGISCNIDCQCNQHSTCTNGSGLCDQCHNFTTGDFCDQCVLNSYGDPASKEGCQNCFCHGNADPDSQCDNRTGVCHCLHNTGGHDCGECQLGYFGSPRDNEECFECYQGRTVRSNFSGSSNFVSRVCHRDEESTVPINFVWQLSIEKPEQPELHTGEGDKSELLFQLVSVDWRSVNPVYLYDEPPFPSFVENTAVYVLTRKDVGVILSFSKSHLTVAHFVDNPSNANALKFKVFKHDCSSTCSPSSSPCSSNTCDCESGYIGAQCKTKLNCVSQNTGWQDCGSQISHISPRHQSAVAETDDLMFIHGGYTIDGTMVDDMYIIAKSTLSLRSFVAPSRGPSARYGHAMACTAYACYIYGGVNSSDSLYLSNQFWRLPFSETQPEWELNDSEIVPELSGHTLTSIALDLSSQPTLILLGGLTGKPVKRIWNTDVFIYNNTVWSKMEQSGAVPSGLVSHSSTYDPVSGFLFVVPGREYDNLRQTQGWMYTLNVSSGVWSALLYDNLRPRVDHYTFAMPSGYLLMVGGYHVDPDRSSNHSSYNTRTNLNLYSYHCNSWVVIDTSQTNFSGNLTQGNILGYSYYSREGNSTLLLVSSDEQVTLISSLPLSEKMFTCNQQSVTTTTTVTIGNSTTDVACQSNVNCSAYPDCASCLSLSPYCKRKMRRCQWDQNRCMDRLESDVTFLCIINLMPCYQHADCVSCTPEEGCVGVARTPTQPAICVSHSTSATADDTISVFADCPSPPYVLPCHKCLKPCSGHSSYINTRNFWSISLSKCLNSDITAVSDGGQLGLVIGDFGNCLQDCSAYDSCFLCQTNPSCGWCSVAGSQSGDGFCARGNFEKGSGCTPNSLSAELRIDVKVAQWNYVNCPPENECLNKHHTCNITIQLCEDLQQGFKCKCRSGYKTVVDANDANYIGACSSYHKLKYTRHYYEPDPLCIPTCSSGCGQHGCCTGIDNCTCDVGFVGENCKLECQCHNHSYCSPSSLASCYQCIHNTTGDSCEHCRHGFAGDPTKSIDCLSCYDVCNGKSDTCDGEILASGAGPLLDDQMRCLNCTAHSTGSKCEDCTPGYFLSDDNDCVPCRCNGHGVGNVCNTTTGWWCECTNNTKSVEYQHPSQCDVCSTGYDGNPTDNHQCYRKIRPEKPICFDSQSGSDCKPLLSGQASFYSLQVLDRSSYYNSAHSRLRFIIQAGVADIYISNSPSSFTVTYDPDIGEHIVTINQTYIPHTDSRDTHYIAVGGDNSGRMKRYARSTTACTESETLKIYETDARDKYELYVFYDSPVILKLTSVAYRAVVTLSKDVLDLKLDKFYIVVKSREGSLSGSLQFATLAPRSNMANIFVQFNITMCGVLLILCATAVIWRVKQLQRIRQLRINRGVELNAMAERPFSSTMMYMDTDVYSVKGAAKYAELNVVPLALEPISNSSAVIATTFMLLPGDESRPVKATMASALLSWRLSFPPPVAKNRDRTQADHGTEQDVAETTL